MWAKLRGENGKKNWIDQEHISRFSSHQVAAPHGEVAIGLVLPSRETWRLLDRSGSQSCA